MTSTFWVVFSSVLTHSDSTRVKSLLQKEGNKEVAGQGGANLVDNKAKE